MYEGRVESVSASTSNEGDCEDPVVWDDHDVDGLIVAESSLRSGLATAMSEQCRVMCLRMQTPLSKTWAPGQSNRAPTTFGRRMAQR